MGSKESKPAAAEEFNAQKNRKWVLKRRPHKTVRYGDLVVEVEDKPSCGDGEVVVKTTLISIDPTHRIWMTDKPQYMPPVEIGEVMRAFAFGEVVESKYEGLSIGDKVVGPTGLQDYAVCPGDVLNKMQPSMKAEDSMSVFSVIIGLTAYHGLVKICKPKKGETVVISGAAGAVGSLAGQIAKIMGARVVGVVGSPSKAKWITEELGFDGAINYKTDNISEKLKELAPNGVDCYFENTGGPTSDAVFMHFNTFARMAFCGLIDTYNKKESPGPKSYNMFLMRRVNVQGFICTDHMDEYPEMLEFVKKHVDKGEIKHKVDVREGLSNYIDVLNLLFSGGNTGKLCLKP